MEINGVLVLNPGSVGLPRDGDPRAGFAIIDDDKIELRRISYPIEETVARVEAMPWPRRAKELTVTSLRLGRLPLEMGPEASGTAILDDDRDPDLDDSSLVLGR